MRSGRSIALALVLAVVAAAGIWLWSPFLPAEVIEGRVYRGRQPSGAELCAAARRLGLRSVVNLRGADPEATWYRDEVAAARACGLSRLDVRFWTEDWPPRAEVQRLIRYLDGAETPVLLHCLGGVHRSGWAAAVAGILADEPYDAALGELSSAPRSVGRAADGYDRKFFELYDAWRTGRGTQHSGEAFREWAMNDYYPSPYHAELAVLRNPALAPVAPGTWLPFRVRVDNRSPGRWEMSPVPGRGISLGAAILGPFAERPPGLLSVFREPGRPGTDIARAGTTEGSVGPGESHEFELAFPAPETPGLYVVHLDMVEEQVHWFSDLGSAGILVDLRVAPGPL